MSENRLGAIILAAGMGTRMKSGLHKVLHPIGGRAMLRHLLTTLDSLSVSRKVIVVGSSREQVEAEVADEAAIAIQEPQLGTGHAVLAARNAMADFSGDVLILYGDVPLTSKETLENLLAVRRGPVAPAVAVLGFRPKDPAHYGRLKVGADGGLEAIVEYKDASPEERAIDLCNSGMMAVDGAQLFALLDRVTNDNANGEYYLTDIVGIARAQGLKVGVAETAESEVIGVNSRAELAAAEAVFQNRMRHQAMVDGATLTDPVTVYFSADTKLGKDVTVGPNVVFGAGVKVSDHVTINAFCHLEGVEIAEGASVGPFARLRPGAKIGKKAKIGNFVEIKKADIGDGAKVSHLSYIGDAAVGRKANIGAGTITCNYDGFDKFRTVIGEGAFIGSNTSLIAPVTIGDGAIVGAGSAISKDVDPGALALTRAEQSEYQDWAIKFRARKNKKD